MKNRIHLLVILSIGLLSGACNEAGNPGQGYDRSAMLENQADNVILPLYQQAVSAGFSLRQTAAQFTTNPGLAQLQALQDTFKVAFLAWKKCEFFTTGPADNLTLAAQVNTWPINEAVIEAEIAATFLIDDAYMLSTGTTRKGFAAVEYLVFPYGAATQDTVLARFTTDINASRRRDYLQSACNVLHQQLADCLNQWDSTAGNYRAAFIAADGIDVGGSATALMNAMIQGLEVVINYKIGVPLGKMSGGVVLPEKAESFRCGISREAIVNNLQVLEWMYTGGNGQGFDDYLDFVNAQYNGQLLSQAIRDKFTQCRNQAAALPQPVHLMVSSDPNTLDALYLSLKQLLVLLKSDMSSRLGLLITFSDNDGD